MTVYVEKVRAMEIFDSRGNPTVEVHAFLSDGTVAKAEVQVLQLVKKKRLNFVMAAHVWAAKAF